MEYNLLFRERLCVSGFDLQCRKITQEMDGRKEKEDRESKSPCVCVSVREIKYVCLCVCLSLFL